MAGELMRVRIVYSDGQDAYRTRLTRVMLAHRELDLVAVTVDGPSAVDAILREQPDLALVAAELPGLDGPALIAALAASDPPVRTRTVLLGDSYRAGTAHLLRVSEARGVLDRGLELGRLCDTLAGLGAPLALAHP